MIELELKDVKPGMVTADAVQTPRGQLIVNADVELTDSLIKRIAFYSIPKIKITKASIKTPEEAAPPIPKGNVQEPTYSQKVKKTPAFHQFQLDYSRHMADCQNIFNAVGTPGSSIDTVTLYNQTQDLMKPNQTTIELFDMLHNMRQVDDSIYAHSINVALIAHNIGTWLKFPAHDLQTLTIAGLLHDIGKTRIPEEVLNKPGKYTDEEFALVKNHPRLGYEILKDQPIDDRIKKAALMHHERCDDSGYPAGLSGEYIDDFALVIAIADVYDAMTAARAYRAPLCPFQVIESFEKEGLQKYKPKYILTFLNRIANTYQSNRVMLSNGKSGNIVLLNDKHLSKPIVELSDGSFLDLSSQNEISIVAVL